MPVRFAPWIVAALCSGCSLILDTGDLPKAPDAPPPPDAPPIDGNRMAFSITGLWPNSPELLEGAGAKGIPLVIRFMGTNIIDPVVTAKFVDTDAPLEITEYHSATTFDEVSVGIRIPVRTDLDVATCATTPVNIHFDFDQADSTPAGFDVPLHCLDELDSLADFVSGNLYSQIDLETANHFTGTTAPVFTATGDITINAVLDVDAAASTGGPGGCDGGAPELPAGSCAGGGAQGAGGGTLSAGGGGGGGGFLINGLPGGGESNGGPQQGNPMLVPLGTSINSVENRGAGGGGGGRGGGGNPGAGGGGGGVITIAAGGEVHVGPGALIRAAGDHGTPGSGALGLTSGGGGGGSGGAILIRSGAGVVFDASPTAWLHAPKGAGGTASGTNAGGSGADGRIRVDQPIASPPVDGMAMAGGLTSGPAWSATTVPFSTDGSISLQLYITPGLYGVQVNGESLSANGGNVQVNASPATVQIPDLPRGYDTICALYELLPDAGALAGRGEAKTCITVVYTPGN